MNARLLPLPRGYRQLLAYRPYRLYFASSGIGSFASAVQFLGQGWLLLWIAPGGWALVAFLAVRLGVKALLAVPAGVIADRLPRATIYAWMRVVSGAGSLISAAAVLSPEPVAVALTGAAVAAAAHALDLPAHRALMGEVQPPEDLERGLSLGSSGFHVAAIAAPMVAFPLAAFAGPTVPLLLSTVAFFVAAVPAFAIAPVQHERRPAGAGHDVRAALKFVAATPIVIALLVATALPSVVDKAIAVSLPSAHGDHGAMGLVLAAPELGAISIGLVLAAMQWRFAPWITLASAGGYALCITVAAVVGIAAGIELVALALFAGGCMKTTLITSALAGIQRHVPPELRGRIMTI